MALVKSTAWFAFGTIISRISGLLRDIIVVSMFGASAALDAFIVAFRVPNLFREMLAEGALANAFTKVYSELKAQDVEKAESFFIQSFQLVLLAGVGVSLIGWLLAPVFIEVMTLYSQPSDLFKSQATGLARLLFPFLGIMMVGSVVTGALYERGRFFLSAVAPVGFNVFYIIGAVALGPLLVKYGPDWIEVVLADKMLVGLAVGVLLGGLMQVSMNAYTLWNPAIKKALKVTRQSLRLTPEIKQAFFLMLPAAIAASTGPINQVVNTNFATSVAEGAVTWLNYSFRILQLPIGVFGVAVGVAILPKLAKQISKHRSEIGPEASHSLQSGCELVMWIIVPCWVFVLINYHAIIDVLFGYGRFSGQDVAATSQALYAYSMGLLSYALIKVLISFYYAVERTSYALKVAVICIGVNFAGNVLLVKHYGHVGLAATSSITLSFNALCLIVGLRKHEILWQKKQLLFSGFAVILAGVCAFLVQRLVLAGLIQTVALSPKMLQMLSLVANGGVVVLIFCAFAFTFFRQLKPKLVG